MSRRLKLPTAEMGELELLAVPVRAGDWGQWEDVRASPLGDLVSVVPVEAFDHALRGWSRPLVDALGLPPQGALRKMPRAARQCRLRKDCIFFDRRKCTPFSKEMPWCYEPDGMDASPRFTEILSSWREGVYVVMVLERPDG